MKLKVTGLNETQLEGVKEILPLLGAELGDEGVAVLFPEPRGGHPYSL